MSGFLCWLWPLLLGGLVGWVLCGLAAKRLKYVEVKEKIVHKEKQVTIEIDNPSHLARIDDLEKQLEAASKPDNEAAALGIGAVGGALAGSAFTSDDLEAKDREIEALNAEIKRLNQSYSELEAAQAEATAVLPAAASDSYQQTELDKAAAKAAGFSPKGIDDFTVVEGIGPKINQLILAANINTYWELSRTNVEDIQKILDNAGPRYALARPETWPKQAELAAQNRWQELKDWQDELDHGR